MTDEQIIKALECCDCSKWCEDCPLKDNDHCKDVLSHQAVDLINHQKTENEKTEKELTEYKLRLKMSECTVDEIKSEAIKEFAERLKSRLSKSSVRTKTHDGKTTSTYVDDIANQILHNVVLQEIDNLVKEMTGA